MPEVLDDVTIDGRTALDNYIRPDPNCEVCGGDGVDPVFESTCTMCWGNAPTRPGRLAAHLHPTLAQQMRSNLIDAHVETWRDRTRRKAGMRRHRLYLWKRRHPLLMRCYAEMRGDG